MTIDQKLDMILALLRELVPNPGYRLGSDNVWRNKLTGESQYEEGQRAQINRARIDIPWIDIP